MRMQSALVALLGVSAILPVGSPGLPIGLVVAGGFLGGIVLLFGSCLVAGWIGSLRIAKPGIDRTPPSRALTPAKASTGSLGRNPPVSRHLSA
jgi:hypothetical protein